MTAPEISYCERCGAELGGGTATQAADAGSDAGAIAGASSDGHTCVGHAEFEPPRYCSRCRRRMVVQLTPAGWSARCSRHGVITSAGADAGAVGG